MKKMIIFAIFASLLWSVPMVSAQTKMRAEGMAVIMNNRVDIAREKALDGALRSAVEKVVGVMVTSSSEVENFQLKLDRILSESKGFISNYKIISEKRQGDQFEVTVEAEEDGLSHRRITIRRALPNRRLDKYLASRIGSQVFGFNDSQQKR
jgi:hypothetical protein